MRQIDLTSGFLLAFVPPSQVLILIQASIPLAALGPPAPPAPPAPSPPFSSTALPAAQSAAAVPSALPPVPVEPVPTPSSQSSPSSASDALEKVSSGNLFCQLIYTPSFDSFRVSICLDSLVGLKEEQISAKIVEASIQQQSLSRFPPNLRATGLMTDDLRSLL